MEKIAIERIVNNFKDEVEMNNFMYTAPNKKDKNGYFYEFTSNILLNVYMKGKNDKKYNQIFKNNYQYVINLKNSKNHLVLNFITKGSEVDNDFVSKIDKIDDGKSDWKVLDFILRNSYVCYVEGRKINHKCSACFLQ